MGLACCTMGERRGAYRVLLRKSKVKKLFGRASLRREINIKLGTQEIRWESVNYIHLTNDRLFWTR
jgi:hypothetical protein